MSYLQQLLWELIREDCVEDKGEDKGRKGEYYDILKEILGMIIDDLGDIEEGVVVREGRGNKVDFAIRRKGSAKYKIIIEFKRSSVLLQSIYYDSESSKLIFKRGGTLENYERWKNGGKEYPAQNGDWVGQLRGYFLSMYEENKLEKDSFSILTNGLLWVIFQFDPEKEVVDSVADSEIVSSFVLPEDYEKLKKKMNGLLA